MAFFNEEKETMPRADLDILIDERVRNTVRYAAENSLFYKKWFLEHKIDPLSIKEHEDLRELPIITGDTIRQNQPPVTEKFNFKSVSCRNVHTINETSGTSGVPKSFFLTWDDWKRYSEKYARIFVSYGLERGDRVAICASYGMNVGASAMTMAAKEIGLTIIPEGKCTFPLRVIESYKPTAIVGSVFKLIRLAKRMEAAGLDPKKSGIRKLIVGGESFAPESRAYLDSLWGFETCNSYGSTEGTMCGECGQREGLHVAEDLIHLDLYDQTMNGFVSDGEEGKIVITTLVPEGENAGTVLINYNTDDITSVISRDVCSCKRTHMRINNPKRDAENYYIYGVPVNRTDVEAAVFYPENMQYLTGEYEAFIYSGEDLDETIMRVSMECEDLSRCNRGLIKDNFTDKFLKRVPGLKLQYEEGQLKIAFRFTEKGGLELYRLKARPKRIVDRR
ncbi:coenzyme F390 synthetase [Methanoplanus limicola]|uniref:Coenzyme F390 synthetase n=1 Tax=Methanoplanus limicola DSM 2279 TaxID=937775 RepID=H1YZS5_9EURY|nr:coenzyme F390 synthetase [Methanoplanus limicola]EHQ34337.1 coenzyme F390 synthetase [Methanoplanus limicola DSM 2279]